MTWYYNVRSAFCIIIDSELWKGSPFVSRMGHTNFRPQMSMLLNFPTLFQSLKIIFIKLLLHSSISNLFFLFSAIKCGFLKKYKSRVIYEAQWTNCPGEEKSGRLYITLNICVLKYTPKWPLRVYICILSLKKTTLVHMCILQKRSRFFEWKV